MNAKTQDEENARRREQRFPVKIEAEVVLDLDGANSTAVANRIRVENLSPNGLCLTINELATEQIPFLAREKQRCSITCRLPGVGVPSSFTGDVTWMSVRFYSPRPDARMGVHLTNAERGRLAQYLDQLAAGN